MLRPPFVVYRALFRLRVQSLGVFGFRGFGVGTFAWTVGGGSRILGALIHNSNKGFWLYSL